MSSIKKGSDIPSSASIERWPYTNLHNLNLDWIINTIKEFAAEVDRFEDSVIETVDGFEVTMADYTQRMDLAIATVDEKIEYINTFFANLDVQEEINNKLNSMAHDGTLAALLKPIADEYMEDNIPGTVTDWLDEHITPTTPIVDDTLTIEGAAADAKAAGDAINANTMRIEMHEGVSDLYGEDGSNGTSEITVTRNGNIITINGTYTASTRRRFNLDDITAATATGAFPTSWYTTVHTPLESNHVYQIRAKHIGGTMTPTSGTAYGYNLLAIDTSGNYLLYVYAYPDELVCTPERSNGTGIACVALTVNQNVAFNNYQIYVDLVEDPELAPVAFISAGTHSGDLNAGSSLHPYQTIGHALEVGHRTLCIAPGVYNETISVDGGDLVIIPWTVGLEYETSVPYRPKIEIIKGTKLTVTSAGDNIYTARYTAAADSNIYKVFVDHTLTPTTDGAYSLEYNALLIGDKPNGVTGNNRKRLYTPVLTEGELASQGTFYYDGTYIKFHPWDNVLDDNYYIPNDASTNGILLQNMDKVHLEDMRVLGCYGHCAYLHECNDVSLDACEFAYSAKGSGLRLDNCNAHISDCHASACSIDGFNIHEYGHSEFYDCTAFYNGDDGISHHQGCSGLIVGGEFAYNGSGGVTPAYGCTVNVKDVYCHHNLIGVQFLGMTGLRRSLLCSGALLLNNTQADLYAKFYDVTAWNCVYHQKELGSYGYITEYNNTVLP